MDLFVASLISHGVLGGIDVIVNHELVARLPRRTSAAPELRLHSAREAIFAGLFLGIGWWQWQGFFAMLPAALMLAELLVSVRDAVVEGATRILPATEAALHVCLFVNLGALYAFGGLQLSAWWQQPARLAPAATGWPGIVLTVMAVLAAGWSLRDALAARSVATRHA